MIDNSEFVNCHLGLAVTQKVVAKDDGSGNATSGVWAEGVDG